MILSPGYFIAFSRYGAVFDLVLLILKSNSNLLPGCRRRKKNNVIVKKYRYSRPSIADPKRQRENSIRYASENCSRLTNRPFATNDHMVHGGGKAHYYYSPTGTSKQRQVKFHWFMSLCFNVPVRE